VSEKRQQQLELAWERCSRCGRLAPRLVGGVLVRDCECDAEPCFDDLGRYLEPPPAGVTL